MAKTRTIKELMGKSCALILPLTNKFELMIEKQENEFFYVIFTPGGDNKFDLTPYVELNVDMTDRELKDAVMNYITQHVVFNGELNPITPKEQIKQSNRLNNYPLMNEIDQIWINDYVMETGDENFENLDPFVIEYINDIMTESRKSSFPLQARKKWDDEEKLIRIRETIIKQIDEFNKNS